MSGKWVAQSNTTFFVDAEFWVSRHRNGLALHLHNYSAILVLIITKHRSLELIPAPYAQIRLNPIPALLLLRCPPQLRQHVICNKDVITT